MFVCWILCTMRATARVSIQCSWWWQVEGLEESVYRVEDGSVSTTYIYNASLVQSSRQHHNPAHPIGVYPLHCPIIPYCVERYHWRAKRVNGLSHGRLSRQNRPYASPDAIASAMLRVYFALKVLRGIDHLPFQPFNCTINIYSPPTAHTTLQLLHPLYSVLSQFRCILLDLTLVKRSVSLCHISNCQCEPLLIVLSLKYHESGPKTVIFRLLSPFTFFLLIFFYSFFLIINMIN